MAELQIGDRHYTRSQLKRCGRHFPVVKYPCLIYYLQLKHDLIRLSVLHVYCVASQSSAERSFLLLAPLEHLARPTSLRFIRQRIPVGVSHLIKHYDLLTVDPQLQDFVCHILVGGGLSDGVLKIVDGGLSIGL